MMRLLSLLGVGDIAASTFKSIPGGYVFKTAPLRRLFGLATYYRVTDAQRGAIQSLFVRLFGLMILVVVPVSLGLMALVGRILPVQNGYDLLAVLAGGAIAGLGLSVCYAAGLRKILKEATPVVEHFTWGEQQVTLVERTPYWRIGLFVAFGLMLLAAIALTWQSSAFSLAYKVAALVFAAVLMASYVTLAIVKAYRAKA